MLQQNVWQILYLNTYTKQLVRKGESEKEGEREKAMTDIEVLRALTSKRVGNMKKHMKEN